jgi:hypothetical protein
VESAPRANSLNATNAACFFNFSRNMSLLDPEIAIVIGIEFGDPVPGLALVCSLVPIVAAAGSVIAPGPSRWPGADMLVGFGLLTGATAILAVTTRLPLSWLMMGLVVFPVIALMQRQFAGGRSTWIALALVLPILVKAAGQEPAAWDDFWNWLPSAAYEYNHNSLPWPDISPSLAIFPGYPQGMPLMIAAASFIGGRFLEAAGPIINVLLLAGSSALFAEALAAAFARHGRLQAGEIPLVSIASAVSITVLLNPGLDGNVVLSSYADCGTMVAVGALGLLGVEILARLSSPQSANAEGIAWRFGFVGAMLVNLKQANPVLLALITAGLILAAFRDPAFRTRRALLQLPRMLGPGIVVFAVWRWYVMHNLANAEQSFRPFEAWHFSALRSIFASIGIYIAEATLFHCLMWLVTAAGIAVFFQLPRKADEARWLAVVCASVWVGYNVFLVSVYLGVMSESDAYGAADYWRYSPHVALLGLYAPVMALAVARWPAWVNLRSAVPTLAMVLVALCVLRMRSDLNNPRGIAWQRFLRAAVADMRPVIPPGSKVVIVSFTFADSLPFGTAIRYYLWQLDLPEQQVVSTIRWDDRDLAAVPSLAARGETDYLIIQDADGSMDNATDALRLPRLNRELLLFVWRDGAWERVKSWPIAPALIHSRSSR